MSSGALPITGYSIRYNLQNSSSVKDKTVTGNITGAILIQLVPGSAYQLFVAAITTIGTGQYCCKGTPLVVRTHNGKLSSVAVT